MHNYLLNYPLVTNRLSGTSSTVVELSPQEILVYLILKGCYSTVVQILLEQRIFSCVFTLLLDKVNDAQVLKNSGTNKKGQKTQHSSHCTSLMQG